MRKIIVLGLLCGVLVAELSHGQRPRPTRQPNSRAAGREGRSIPETDPGLEADVLADYMKMADSLTAKTEESKELVFYSCKNVQGRTVKKVLENFLTPLGTVADNDETDVIAISDDPANIEDLLKIAERVDTPVPQVLVEARVVELTIDSDYEREINLAYQHLPETADNFVKDVQMALGTPGSNPREAEGALMSFQPWSEASGNSQELLTLFLRYLQTRGRAKILSAPSLILRRGAEGSIITGEEVPILTQTVVSGSISTSTEFKSVGIKLRVLPISVVDGRVRVEIAPEVSTVTGFTTSGETGLSNPTIAVRNAATELEVQSGQLVSIGGLYRTEQREVRRQVPVLGSIPLLGHLFRSARDQQVETQLVIFLTIRVVNAEDAGPDLVKPTDVPSPIREKLQRMQAR